MHKYLNTKFYVETYYVSNISRSVELPSGRKHVNKLYKEHELRQN